MRLRIPKSSLHSTDDGSVLIEATIVVPLLIFMLVGLADFGRAYVTMSAAQKSLRGAVRYLTLLPAPAVCTWGFTNAQNLALYGHVGAPAVGETPLLNSVTKITPATCTDAILRTTPIKLEATVTYNPMILSVWAFKGGIDLTVEHEERWIGQ